MAPRHGLRERGAVAVEMAIVLPLLLLLVGGIIDFGRAYLTNLSLSTVAREGVRAAVMIPSATPACPVVNTCIQQRALVASPGATVVVNQNCVGATAASLPARVTASDPTFDFLMLDGLLGLFGATPPTPSMSETAQMRCNV
jgi:Flp pilus assembly protein TadG